MANVQHSSLTDPNLHEPKGISTASSGDIYIADGVGSGNWRPVHRTGWAKFSNTTYTGTTTLAISTTYTLIPFTTAVDETQTPINNAGTASPSTLLDVALEKFQFDQVGSLYLIDISFEVYSPSGTPKVAGLRFNTSTDGSTYGTSVSETYISLDKGAGQKINHPFLLPVTSNMVTHGCKLYFETDTGTINIINIGAVSARIHRAR
jgi:hypothetical protein